MLLGLSYSELHHARNGVCLEPLGKRQPQLHTGAGGTQQCDNDIRLCADCLLAAGCNGYFCAVGNLTALGWALCHHPDYGGLCHPQETAGAQ